MSFIIASQRNFRIPIHSDHCNLQLEMTAGEVIQAIQALSGQEYAPIYASVHKAQLNGNGRSAAAPKP